MDLSDIEHIVSVGSIDGVLTTASLISLTQRPAHEVGLEFCQAFTVDRIQPANWPRNRRLALVNLAVNRGDPAMTALFVARVRGCGHQILAICDEHDRDDWRRCLGSFEGLLIEPQSQRETRYKSASAVLREGCTRLGVALDAHTESLLEAADRADQGDFDTEAGTIANQAIKPSIHDDSRRIHAARWLAHHSEPDNTIREWMSEYTALQEAHEDILSTAEHLGDGIYWAESKGRPVDRTGLMFAFYRRGARIVALLGDCFIPREGRHREAVCFGSSERLDIRTQLRDADIRPLGGFGNKVNVEVADAVEAIEVLRGTLRRAGSSLLKPALTEKLRDRD